MASKLITWLDDEVEFFGQTVRLKLKLPQFGGAAELVKRVEEIRKTDDAELVLAPDTQKWVADVFAKWVRLPEPLEVDGVMVDSGPALFEVASPGLVLRILGRLVRNAFLGEREGKVSASPSMPSVEGGSGSGGSSSHAESTAPEAGPTP